MNEVRDYLVEKTGGRKVIELIVPPPPTAAAVHPLVQLGRAEILLDIFHVWPGTN